METNPDPWGTSGIILKKKTYRKQKENAVNNNHWFRSCYVSAVLSVFKSSIFFKSYFKYVKFSLTCRGEEESGWTLCQDNKKHVKISTQNTWKKLPSCAENSPQ